MQGGREGGEEVAAAVGVMFCFLFFRSIRFILTGAGFLAGICIKISHTHVSGG